MTEAAGLDAYKVDKDLCIDCNACYTSYPQIFKRVEWNGEFKAEEYAPTESGKIDPWDIVGVCPTDAIAKIGEMPPKPEKKLDELPPLEDLGPWEERWEKVKDQKDSQWEIMKRYGMAATLSEEVDRYVIKMEFPEKAPIHILRYQLGLPDTMPDYSYTVELNPDDCRTLVIVGKMTDGHFKKLCGKINSFPDRFRRVFKLPDACEISRQRYSRKILMIELKKTAAVAA